MFSSVGSTHGPFRPCDHGEAGSGGVDREPVEQVQADHLGVDQVVPVVADAGDPQ